MVETWFSSSPVPHPAETPAGLVEFVADGTGPVAAAIGKTWRFLTIFLVQVAAFAYILIRAAVRWMVWRRGGRHRRRQTERQQAGTWARRRTLSPLLEKEPLAGGEEPTAAGRLWVGSFGNRDAVLPERTSLMVVAPTRTGKSSRIVVPNLLRWDGPALVTSVKRDVYDLTVERRRAFGPVALFDPAGSTGLPSMRWSPLLSSLDFPSATQTSTWLADAAAVQDKGDSARFWETLATKLLAPMLYAAANTGRTITDVSHWVDRSAFDEVTAVLESLGDEDALAAWKAMEDLPTETRGSVLGTAMAIFRAFGSPRVRERTSCHPGDTEDAIDLDLLLRENGTLYLVSPEHDQAELRPLFTALVQAVHRRGVEVSANLLGGAPLNPPLLMMLDEAGNIAPMRNLPRVASTGAGQGITLATIWQDRAQIRDLYGESDRTVIANHTTSVWLPGSQDLDTLRFLADLIGDQWVASDQTSTGPDGSVSRSRGTERIQVAPPSFLRTMDADTAVMLHGNLPPAQVTTVPYYDSRRWLRHIPKDVVRRYASMHDGSGPSTADAYGDRPEEPVQTTATTTTVTEPEGPLSDLLGAAHPEIVGDRRARIAAGPIAVGIPVSLTGGRRDWPESFVLPPAVAEELGIDSPVDLRTASIREAVVAALVTCGQADAISDLLTLPMLQHVWSELDIPLVARGAWQSIYPQLTDAIRERAA